MMITSCYAGILPFVRAHVPAALTTPDALSRVQELLSFLPDAFSSYYLECRLSADSDQVDLMGCVRGTDGGRERLAQHLKSREAKPQLAAWGSVARLCESWSTPGSLLYRLLPHIWLAFDLDDRLPSLKSPCVLHCLDQQYFRRPRDAALPARLVSFQFDLLFHALFERLLEGPQNVLQERNLRSCQDLLPPAGRLIHLSLMLGRSPQACKVNISLPKKELGGYLTRVGWPGSHVELDSVVSRFCLGDEPIKFQLTVGESIAPLFELELHFDNSAQWQPRYHLLLEHIRETGYCAVAKYNALREWPGRYALTLPGQQWPTNWATWTDIKIVLTSNHKPSAKAYLGFMPDVSLF